MTHNITNRAEAKPGWLTSAAATTAVVLSAALAGFGIASAFWPRLVASGSVLPIDPASYESMTDDELAVIESRASAAKALAQHARRRRQKAA